MFLFFAFPSFFFSCDVIPCDGDGPQNSVDVDVDVDVLILVTCL